MSPPTQVIPFTGAGLAAPAPAQPAVPATNVVQQNVNAYPVQVVIGANGATISNVSVNGVTAGTAAGTYTVPAFGSISIAYTVATPTWTWSNATSGGAAVGADSATWNTGTSTLTDTVTAGGALVASFAGQAYAFLNTPLQGWLSGNSS
jgi:hypothetical protein